MSNPDQPSTPPLTRRQMRDLRNTGSTPIQNPQEFRDFLYKNLNALQVFGRIYVAKEGINAQISVPSDNMDAFRSFLYSIEPLNNLRLNIAVDDDGKSFWVLKIKVREKIVADGIDDPAFSMERKGKYVNAREMNELLEDPGTIVIDPRARYLYLVMRDGMAVRY